MRRFLHLLPIAVLSALPAAAAPLGHGPFEPGHEPGQVRLRDCQQPTRQGKPVFEEAGGVRSTSFTLPGSPGAPAVRVRSHKAAGAADKAEWDVFMVDAAGARLSGVETSGMPSEFFSVLSADLNGDGKPDYILQHESGGCGLAAAISTLVFFVSEGDRYAGRTMDTFSFGPEDIVRLKKDGPCYFIQSDLRDNGREKTKDGRDHSFWVYELHRFDRNGMAKANADDARFPKWVWYTRKDGHRETDQLTAAQKKRLMAAGDDLPG